MYRLLACLVLTFLFASTVRAEQSPKAYTQTLLDEFKRLKSDKGLNAAEKAANDKIVNELDSSFDFEGITTKLMSTRADKFTPAQREEFKKKFHELIRAGTFVDSGDFFRRATIEFQPEKAAGGVTTVPVHVTVPAEDTDMVIGLQWKNMGGKLKVVDVLIDGDSLVKDYQNQVARIVDKKGVPGLMQSLDERRAQVDKKVNKAQ